MLPLDELFIDKGVFVEPAELFLITDGLNVIPNVPASVLELLENSGSTDFEVVEEKTFQIGYTEVHLFCFEILNKH